MLGLVINQRRRTLALCSLATQDERLCAGPSRRPSDCMRAAQRGAAGGERECSRFPGRRGIRGLCGLCDTNETVTCDQTHKASDTCSKIDKTVFEPSFNPRTGVKSCRQLVGWCSSPEHLCQSCRRRWRWGNRAVNDRRRCSTLLHFHPAHVNPGII